MNHSQLYKFPENKIPSVTQKIEKAIKSFAVTERLVFLIFITLFAVSSLAIAWKINLSFLSEVPEKGGTLTEGIIGSPRFVNPLLAISDADRDLTSLVYSGLFKATPDGELIKDSAADYTISADSLSYTVILKDNLYFHDGMPVTTDDVEYTVQKVQDPALKSPKRANWEGITAEKKNDREIKFILKQPYAPFLENLTLGIIPKHIWKTVPSEEFSFSQFNVKPIGSGPYKVKSLKRNSGGLPILYALAPFKKYALGEPFVSSIKIRFYQNESELLDAYKSSTIESINGISPIKASELKNKGVKVDTSVLPRVFGVFFNQSQLPVLVNKEVRLALDQTLNKERIVNEVLQGFGIPIGSPIPPRALFANVSTTTTEMGGNINRALETLTRAGWKPNESTGIMEKKNSRETTSLKFSISTGDTEELKLMAEIIKEEWTKIGASVDIKIFETGDLNQNVIRPRKYDALLFGEVVGREGDFYPFWHSSQRNDPGLNIASYANITVDKLLEDIRKISSKSERGEKYQKFEKIINDEVPAVFTYSPAFIYITPPKIKNIKLGQLTTPSERFLNVHEWYIETNKVWKIFNK